MFTRTWSLICYNDLSEKAKNIFPKPWREKEHLGIIYFTIEYHSKCKEVKQK